MNAISPHAAAPLMSDRPRFFMAMSLLLLLIVVVGFSPTFFLRAVLDVPDISTVLFVHGFVMTSWYVCLFAQTTLVALRRTDLHRALGVLGVCIAFGVVVTGIATHFDLVARAVESESGPSSMTRVAALVWLDLAALAAFAGCIVFALVFRANAAVHKRLMLLASIAIIGPALSRIAGWPVLGSVGAALVPIVSIALLIAPVAYDVLGRRRGRLASSFGALFVLAILIGGIVLGSTEFGLAFARSFG